MTSREDRLALKRQLGRTWTAFFERYGNFTKVQLAAIPILLAGENALICAPTASGKTESAIVPLIERHITPRSSDLTILYLSPTRALVNDLLGRLSLPFEALDISLAAKTHDVTTFDPQHPARLLITTPESFDSLLTSYAQLCINLRAVVIDEIHLFDSTVRGNHLRVLLRRLAEIREYAASQGQAPDSTLQYVALSATVANPEQLADRYFANAHIVNTNEQRPLKLEQLPLSEDSAAELLEYLATFRAKDWKKALIFCNSRSEVETYARAVRDKSPFGNAVYVHYSNIAPQRRQEIEARFASDEVALCFATNTLELGIDVGNIDIVILLGPPGNQNAFAQRVGRGNRRTRIQRVACFYRSPLERLIFEALATSEIGTTTQDSKQHFRLSVVIQQIFSLIKQSPSASIRLSRLSHLFADLVNPVDLKAILGHLQGLGYLKIGRPGEWRPATKLDNLFDQQARTYVELSIYGNIQANRQPTIEIRDQYTHEIVANVDAQWFNHSVLTLEGRPQTIEWLDGEAIWVSSYQGQDIADKLQYRGTRKHLSFELAQSLSIQLGLETYQVPFLATKEGWLCFHWLGDLYGHVLAQLLSYHMVIYPRKSSGLYFHLRDDPQTVIWSSWTIGQVRRYVEDHYRNLEPFLDLGAFHHLLPGSLRRQAVVEQFDVPRFHAAMSALQISSITDSILELLLNLLS